MEIKDQSLQHLHQALQRLVGLHRQLLDTVRMERQALVQANLKEIQEATLAKQAIVQAIGQAENDRLRAIGGLAVAWKKNPSELTIKNIVMLIEASDAKTAEHFRTIQNTLTILIQRISEQNKDNQGLVERSIHHINTMAKNVLGESVPHANTYTARAQRSEPVHGARLISKEA